VAGTRNPFCSGKLIDHLVNAGHVLAGAYGWPDNDARVSKYDIEPGVIAITNPPYWSLRRELHPLICNISDQMLFWALMSADWMHNISSADILHHSCRMIVSARRVKWIEDSPSTAKDNASWYQFGQRRPGPRRRLSAVAIGPNCRCLRLQNEGEGKTNGY
jgi:hypothetical protein